MFHQCIDIKSIIFGYGMGEEYNYYSPLSRDILVLISYLCPCCICCAPSSCLEDFWWWESKRK